MNEALYRKKSLDKIKSPEILNDYIRVTGTGTWLLLAALAIFLVGFLIWGIFGQIEVDVNVPAVVRSNTLICDISEVQNYEIEPGMIVSVGSRDSKIDRVDGTADTATAALDLPDGNYTAGIITEYVSPIRFVLN